MNPRTLPLWVRWFLAVQYVGSLLIMATALAMNSGVCQ